MRLLDSKSVLMLLVFLSTLILYILIVQVKLYLFRKSKGRNVIYRMFWLYNKKLIGNFPSKSEQHLFKTLNMITLVGNVVLFLMFVCYIVLSALGK